MCFVDNFVNILNETNAAVFTCCMCFHIPLNVVPNVSVLLGDICIKCSCKEVYCMIFSPKLSCA